MSKMSTERPRLRLNGATMGTRWSAALDASPDIDPVALTRALQRATDEVDAQMSVWNPGSDLMRLNASPAGTWIAVPAHLLRVLALALDIGRASGGAFDAAVGDAVRAWGFVADAPSPDRIRAAAAPRRPAHEAVELDRRAGRVRKTMPVTLDLNAVAKGYGVDRLAGTLRDHGIPAALVGIDGEMRGFGLRRDGRPWMIAVEQPDPDRRAAHSVLALHDAAVATSGDYRHRVEVGGRLLSHTMDPWRGAPLTAPPASVTVVAGTCAEADAWATALMVLGADAGADLARAHRLNALFLLRGATAAGIRPLAVGPIFGAAAAPTGGG